MTNWNWDFREYQIGGNRLSNAAVEALNGLIQTTRRKSRGCDRPEHSRAKMFLLGTDFTFDRPERTGLASIAGFLH